MSFSRRHGADGEGVDTFAHQVAEGGVDLALALDAVEAREGGTFYCQRKMTFASGIVAGVADMLVALIFELEMRGAQRDVQSFDHFPGDGAGGSIGHGHHIEAFGARGSG